MRLDLTLDVVFATIGGVLVADGVLMKTKHRAITDVLRSNKRWYFLGVAVLSAHVLNLLGPVDPFKLLGAVFGL